MKAILALLMMFQFVSTGHPRSSGGSFAYAHVHSITIDHTKVGSSNSANFPAYFGGTYSWLATTAHGGQINHTTTCCANTETVPADLIFTSDSGCLTQLPGWDIPTWNATSGLIEAYINVPTVSSSADTVIYACTGGSPTTYQATYTSTWNSGYSAVWHFGDGTILDLHDSTTNANTCTNHGVTAATPLTLTGGGAGFVSSSSQYMDCGAGASLNITGDFMGEALIEAPTLAGGGVFPMVFSNTGGTNGYELYQHDNTGLNASAIVAQLLNSSSISSSPSSIGLSMSINTIYQAVARWTSGSSFNLFVDNFICTFCNPSYSGATGSSTNHLLIGSARSLSAFYWNGTLDEIRISNTARSNDWVTAQYNNLAAPGAFYSVVSIR